MAVSPVAFCSANAERRLQVYCLRYSALDEKLLRLILIVLFYCLPKSRVKKERRESLSSFFDHFERVVKMAFALSTMQLRSTVFDHGGRIPRKHTGEGENVSPELQWVHVPEGTRSFAVACHDPDAPRIEAGQYGVVHWVLYNIPASVTRLPEGAEGYTVGNTRRGSEGYFGPMPPPGHGAHHYYFMIFALKEDMNLPPGLTLWQLLERIEPHVLGMSRLIGTYERTD
jgi:Raf kinase inhibitor-like YbhB/YbcL family protein